MKKIRNPNWKKIIWILFGLRYATLLFRSFLPLGLPEIWRQSDTLGVALRYWSRWTVETSGSGFFLPAVLNSGDDSGIMPMEFPVLDMLLAPAFALGPQNGKTLACLILFTVVFALVGLNAKLWRNHKLLGISASDIGLSLLLLPLLSVGGDFVGKAMPDFLAMLLVLIALGLSWKKPNRIPSLILASLGLLLKPTSIAVFAVALAHPQLKNWIRSAAIWVVVAIGIAGSYYTLGLALIKSHQTSPGLFYLATKMPWVALGELGNFRTLRLFLERTFFPYGIFLVAGIYFVNSRNDRKPERLRLWGILVLQFMLVGAMAGRQALSHDYYWMAMTIPCALLFGEAFFLPLKSRLIFQSLLMLGLVIRVTELTAQDLHSLYRSPRPYWVAQRECGELKSRHPEWPWNRGLVFRTANEPFPRLGLCFGERTNGKVGEFGFYWNEQTLPEGCTAIDQASVLVIARCSIPSLD